MVQPGSKCLIVSKASWYDDEGIVGAWYSYIDTQHRPPLTIIQDLSLSMDSGIRAAVRMSFTVWSIQIFLMRSFHVSKISDGVWVRGLGKVYIYMGNLH